MEDPALAFILDEALALLEEGEDLEAIIERFPDFSARLLPLLRVASTLRDTADDAIDIPVEALKDIGDFLQDRFDDLDLDIPIEALKDVGDFLQDKFEDLTD